MALTPSVFRRLLLVYAGTVVLGVVVGLGDIGAGYSPLLKAAYESEPGWMDEMSFWGLASVLTVVLVYFGALIASLTGLYLFRRWGRTLALWCTAGGLLLSAMMGPILSGGLETMLGELATTLWGSLLALAYFGPISTAFSRQAVAAPPAAVATGS
jgi:hypothetical protein